MGQVIGYVAQEACASPANMVTGNWSLYMLCVGMRLAQSTQKITCSCITQSLQV